MIAYPEPVGPYMVETEICLGRHRIAYVDLAEWLAGLHTVAKSVATYHDG